MTAQGYAAPGQPYAYLQQPYPGQPVAPQQAGYPAQAWGSAPMQAPSQPAGYAMQADPSQQLQQQLPGPGERPAPCQVARSCPLFGLWKYATVVVSLIASSNQFESPYGASSCEQTASDVKALVDTTQLQRHSELGRGG